MQALGRGILVVATLAVSSQVVTAAGIAYSTLVTSTPGLGVYYQLDEAAGSTSVVDSTGNTGPGTPGSGVTLGATSASPALNTAASFNGSGTADITVPNNGVLNVGTGAFSIELWYKTNVGGRTDLLTYKALDSSSDLGLQSDAQGANSLSYYHNGYVAKASGVTDSTWHYLVVTRTSTADNTNGTVTVYVDGVAAATGTDTLSINETTAPLYIGSNHDATPTPALTMNGSLDELAFYGTVLTPAQIAAHYAAGVPEPTSLCLAGIGAMGLLARRRR